MLPPAFCLAGKGANMKPRIDGSEPGSISIGGERIEPDVLIRLSGTGNGANESAPFAFPGYGCLMQ